MYTEQIHWSIRQQRIQNSAGDLIGLAAGGTRLALDICSEEIGCLLYLGISHKPPAYLLAVLFYCPSFAVEGAGLVLLQILYYKVQTIE